MDLSQRILSDVTVYMKYAKYLPDEKRRETWSELVTRNMDMHIKKYPMLKDEIIKNYQYVYDRKVLPSMRSLQFGGKPIEISPNRIYNCFGRETEFITSEGTKSFNDFENADIVTVLTHTGGWKKAVVKNYGKQHLFENTFSRGKSQKKVRATLNHRWILFDGTETTDLQKNVPLYPTQKNKNFDYNEASPMERLYWCYGYVFGDGTLLKKDGEAKYSMVRLCGNDAMKYLYRFKEMGFETSTSNSLDGDIMVYTGKYLKTTPDITVDGLEKVKAFMDGYLSADGAKNPDWYENNTLSKYKSIQSSQQDHIEFLQTYLEVCGYYITNISDLSGERPFTKSFSITNHIGSRPNTSWSMTNQVMDMVEDVWCLEVEDDKSFVLSGGIVTGNCCYLPIDHIECFPETMFLLLGGTGVGYSVQKHHVEKLPEIRKPKSDRKRRFLISDSIEGWADAIKVLMKSYTGEITSTPEFDYSDIRQKGARLVTSGGKAPGPQPLKDCIHNIKKILDNKFDGDKLSTIEVHDIICYIADAVLAGGIRRAALIALFSADDDEMISCKSGNWWESNPQRGRANNSAVLLRHKITRDFFNDLWKRIELSGSGEPGIYLTNDKDWGTNPSLRAGTKVLTTEGILPIEELQDKTFRVKNLNGDISDAKCWLSGRNQQLVKLILEDGTEYFATKEHEWPVWDGEKYVKVKTPELTNGDKLPIIRENKLFDGNLGIYDDGFLCGWVIGDGWVSDRKEYSEYGLIVSDTDDESNISDKLLGTIKTNVPTFNGTFNRRFKKEHQDFGEEMQITLVDTHTKELSINNKSVDAYIKKFGIVNKNVGLPKAVWVNGSEDFRKGLIDGLFSSDGNVSKTQKRITFTSSHKQLINDVSELLGFYGIKNKIITGKSNLDGYDKEFVRYDLRICETASIKHFISLFKLTNKYKQAILDSYEFRYNIHDDKQIKVESVELTDMYEDVWDISVFDTTHCFQISKLITGNCCEIALRPYQFCNLCEVNVANIESQEDYNERVRAAAFIGTLQAGYTDFHYIREVWKRTTEKEALIGVGMTGIGSGVVLNYDMNEAANIVKEENARVAKIIGINMAARTTTVKPSGTSSLALGTSSGIHAWFNKYYVRRMRVGKNESIYTYLLIYHPELIEDEYFRPHDTAVISVPQMAPDNSILRTESSIQLLERVKRVSMEWIKGGHRKGENTHNVSATISIKNDEWGLVGDWMWDNKEHYNGLSVLPYDGGSYIQAPFEDITEEKYYEMMGHLSNIDLSLVIEADDNTDLAGELACSGGGCEVK